MLKARADDVAHSERATGRHAVVIGGGLGGMAASLRLRAKGYRVTLFDRAPMLGGRAQVFEKDGFRYDAGPTVITAPFLFEELFALFGRRMDDYVTLVPLDPWYRFRFPDGETFDYGGTIEETLAEIRRFEPADADGYLRLLAHSEKLFNRGFTGLADQPFHNVWTMLAQAPALMRLGSHRTVWQMISKYLKHPKLRQAFSIQPLLVGGSPFDTTSIYGLIHFLERKWGVHFAMGGTGAMIAGIGRLMREVGVDIRLNETVARVTLDGRQGDRRGAGEWREHRRRHRRVQCRPDASVRRNASRRPAGHRAETENARRAAVDGAVPPLFRHAPAISGGGASHDLAGRTVPRIARRHLQAEGAGQGFLALYPPPHRDRSEFRAAGLR